MNGSSYFVRLFAALATFALLAVLIVRPDSGARAISVVAGLKPTAAPLAQSPCAIGKPALQTSFAAFEDILSVSPLGGVTAPGEILPAPYMRVNMRQGQTIFERQQTDALAPARADITAIERRIIKDAAGKPQQSWTVHFALCKDVSVYYDRLDAIDESLLKNAGGLAAFHEIGGPNHLALETRLRVNAGTVIGVSDGFDIGLHDQGAPATTLARPERYRKNAYAQADVLRAPPSLLQAISTDQSKARCPLDYLPTDLKDAWSAKLGDAFGIRRAKGDNACRTALIDVPDTAQGAWFTDSSHNAVTTKVSAVALAPDTIDQSRLIFALHGRAPSLSADLVALAPMQEEARQKAVQGFITVKSSAAKANAPRVNTPFALVSASNDVFCYEGLRANFVGPKIIGVVLMQITPDASGTDLLTLEVRGDADRCAALPQPWAFTGAQTTFYR